jgi:hypothetical protein
MPHIPKLNFNQINENHSHVTRRAIADPTRSASTRSTRLSGGFSNSFDFFGSYGAVLRDRQHAK